MIVDAESDRPRLQRERDAVLRRHVPPPALALHRRRLSLAHVLRRDRHRLILSPHRLFGAKQA